MPTSTCFSTIFCVLRQTCCGKSKKIAVSDHCNHSLFWCMPSYWWYQVNWGEWNLPMRVCDFYLAMDVVCSTSSIFHLVAISIDRWSQWWVLCHGDYGLRDYDDNKYVPSLRTLSTRPSPLGMWAVGPIIRCKWTNLIRDQLTGGPIDLKNKAHDGSFKHF